MNRSESAAYQIIFEVIYYLLIPPPVFIIHLLNESLLSRIGANPCDIL